MKPVLTIILTLLFFYANAQSKKIEAGIKIGLGFSSSSPNKFVSTNGETINYSAQGSLIAGAKALFPLTNQFNFLPEFILLGKGAKVNDGYSILKTFYQFNLNGLYRSRGSEGGLIFGAGPFIAFTKNHTYNPAIYKTDAGINILAGYQIPIGFSFELHYMKSFTKQNLGYDYFGSGQDKREVTFSNLGFTVGYFF